MSKLLNKKKEDRLGAKDGVKEILAHPLFKDLNLDSLESYELKPPFMPDFEKEDFFNTLTS